jgi:hypothetical protein
LFAQQGDRSEIGDRIDAGIGEQRGNDALRMTLRAPIVLPAPGVFSITTGWPSLRDSGSDRMRATTSMTPPAAKGTTTRTGREGYGACARARAGAASMAASRGRRAVIGAVSGLCPQPRAISDHTDSI